MDPTSSILPITSSVSEEWDKFYDNNIRCPEESARCSIAGLDISKFMYDYQMHIRNILDTTPLNLGEHYHLLLSLSSIVLLEKPYSHDAIPIFVGSLLPTIQKICRRTIELDYGCYLLSILVLETQGITRRIVQLVNRILESFPMEQDGQLLNERDLSSRFLLPILQALFDDNTGTNNIYFKLNEESSMEYEWADFSITHRQPDGSIILKHRGRNATIGYMEVRDAAQSNHADKLNMDLIRLGIFGKKAIDSYNLTGIMLVRAVGPTMTFYLQQKQTGDVYTMLELYTLDFPICKTQIPAFYGELDQVADIVHVFEQFCKYTDTQGRETEQRETISSPLLRGATMPVASRKRRAE